MNPRLDRLRRRAASYLASGQAAAASIALESLLAEQPDDDRARLDLGLALLYLDRYRDARAQTLAACVHAPGDPTLALARLEALRVFAEHGRMREIAAAVDDLDALSPRDLTLGAASLQSFGASDLARRWVDAAVMRAPDDLLARVNRAMIALQDGRIDAAEHDLVHAAADTRLVPMAHWHLAKLRTQDVASNHVDRLRNLLARPGLQAADRAPLAFALHKELDDLGRHADAWDALQAGLQAKRQQLQADGLATGGDHEGLVDALCARFNRIIAPASPHAPPPGPAPIFIVGMFRSGTSLLERILEAHPQVAPGGESQRLGAQLRDATNHHASATLDRVMLDRVDGIDADALGAAYVEAHCWLAAGRSHFTEKLPDNYLLLGLIRRALPQARVLHLVRDPVDTCWSNLRELFAGDRVAYSYDQVELAQHCARYRRVMQHWHRVLPGFVLDVPYEGLVRDPDAWAQRVFAFCGLDWVPDATRIQAREGAVRTASAAQVREPIHTRSLQRWAPYASQLRPLRVALQHFDVAG